MEAGMDKIYLAACFEQQAVVREKADELYKLGFLCTSSWRFEDGSLPPEAEHLNRCAEQDLKDLRHANYFVCLTDMTSQRGGKHVEFGYALALNIPIIIVGRRENIFHSLKEINFVETWSEALDLLLSWQEKVKAIEESV
jgi:nucleoside 2-deoxyribosyltransferase